MDAAVRETKSDLHAAAPAPGLQERFLPHHIKIMKVALALAILRQKPRDVSAREYTGRLGLQFSQLQASWRERAEQLARELLRTRQELASLRAHTETLSAEGPVSMQWRDSGYCSSSQGQLQNSVTAASPAVSTATASAAVSTATDIAEDRISTHVKFLASVSSILSAGKHMSALAESDLRAVSRDTLLEAIKGLSESVESTALPILPSSPFSIETAVQVIIDVTRLPLLSPCWSEVQPVCCALVKAIVVRLTSHNHLGKDLQNEHGVLTSLLVVLGSVPLLNQQATELLITAVVACAVMLTNSLTDVSLLDAGQLDHTAAVFKTLEELFLKYDISTLPEDVRANLTHNLEASVLELSTAYPLFTYSVWTIVAHLSSTHLQ